MRLAVLGVGLIGGSIGLAARSGAGGRAGVHVVGYDPDEQALSAALKRGAIDEAAGDIAAAVADAQVVFAAAPIGALIDTARAALDAAASDCVVSDVGSTKQAIVEAIEDERFVGGHPLAGAETAGVEHARADLFDGAAWYLTPGAHACAPLVQRLRDVIATFGARPVIADAGAHDRLMAHVSHLPHIFANVLVNGAAHAAKRERAGLGEGPLTGPSFRDATRVAGANAGIWPDIYISNRAALIDAIDEAIERLSEIRGALAQGDAHALATWNERVRAERAQLTRAGDRAQDR